MRLLPSFLPSLLLPFSYPMLAEQRLQTFSQRAEVANLSQTHKKCCEAFGSVHVLAACTYSSGVYWSLLYLCGNYVRNGLRMLDISTLTNIGWEPTRPCGWEEQTFLRQFHLRLRMHTHTHTHTKGDFFSVGKKKVMKEKKKPPVTPVPSQLFFLLPTIFLIRLSPKKIFLKQVTLC